MTSHDFEAAAGAAGNFRWLPRTFAALGLVLTLVVGMYVFWPDWRAVHREDGPLETWQFTCAVAALLTAATIIVRQRGADRLNAAWLTVLFLLWVARELDLQEQLNEEVLGDWAVSYKLDWWASFDIPLHVKLMWGGAAAVLGLAIFVPPLIVRAPAMALLQRGDAGTWHFLGGCLFYGCGYLLDDILGRGVLVDGDEGQQLEEVCETIGAVGLLASTVITLRHPLTRRMESVKRRTEA